jgi:hypothetical protein
VLSGGTIGGAVIAGGTLEIDSGGSAGSSTIVFGGGGTLRLDQVLAYDFLVASFGVGDAFDFAAIPFVSGSTSTSFAGNTSSGILTVKEGTHSASIELIGNYTAATFNLGPESGGGTGTVVTDPPVTSNGASPLAPPHG